MAKLGTTSRQTLSRRVIEQKRRLPMSSEDALAVLAHQLGIHLDQHLDTGSLARVSDLVSRLGRGQLEAAAGPGDTRKRVAKPASPGRSPNVTVGGKQLGIIPGLSAAKLHDAKRMADEVYPLLYLFENSARGVITMVLRAQLGETWWDQVTNSDIRRDVKKRIEQEGADAWHSKRGTSPLDYLDLPDLVKIVEHSNAWPHFTELFPRKGWFAGLVDDLNVSRRVTAHMNPLTADDIKQVEAAFRKWARQVQAHADKLPA